MVEEEKRASFFGQNEAGGQSKGRITRAIECDTALRLAIGLRLTVGRRPTTVCDPQPFL